MHNGKVNKTRYGFLKQMSLIYWIRNTKTDAELVLPKHGILSRKEERDNVNGSVKLGQFEF